MKPVSEISKLKPSVNGGLHAVPQITDMQKAGLLQAVTQLEMLSMIFPNAPERVIQTHKEFVESMKEWANA